MSLSTLRSQIFRAQHGYCHRCNLKVRELHHRLPNTKTNRKLFPLFIDSPFNLVGLCGDCHTNHKEEYDVTEDMAVVYEAFLKTTRKCEPDGTIYTTGGAEEREVQLTEKGNYDC